MRNIYLHILDAAGSLNKLRAAIDTAFTESLASLPKNFVVNNVDIVVQDLPTWVVPELGIVGHTYSGHIIHISLDSNRDVAHVNIVKTIIHELHHAARWQSVGFGSTLGEAIVSEGLACLLEEEICGETPIYSKVKISKKNVTQVQAEMNKEQYDRSKWFFGSQKDIPRWFGYTYGYEICKKYANLNNTSASKMVSLKARKILSSTH
ncbi:MAG: DUF2268 domain-containing putative Zn-dependent protease [Patescibacteria group bacterium]|mgnify:CR=1 FL=1